MATKAARKVASAANRVKKVHRYHPGTVALREILRLQPAVMIIKTWIQISRHWELFDFQISGPKKAKYPFKLATKAAHKVDTTASGVKKVHIYRPGTVALREILRLQQ